MADGTVMPSGVSIFEELGRSAVPQAATSQPTGEVSQAPGVGGDTQAIVDLIQTGNVNDLVRANSMLQKLMQTKVGDAQREAGAPVTKPTQPAQAQPSPAQAQVAPPQPAPTPQAAPTTPQPGQAPSANVLADLTKLVNAASKIGPQGETAAPQGVMAPGATSTVPPRPTNPQAGTQLTNQLVPGRNPMGGV